jgi:ankyrin repeat protein
MELEMDNEEFTDNVKVMPNTEINLALYEATTIGDIEGVQSLIEKGADVHTRDRWGFTVLHEAVHMNRYKIAAILVENGANVSANPLETPIMVAAGFIGTSLPCAEDMFDLLIKAGADVNAPGDGGMTPLHLAARAGNMLGIHCLLKNGARDTISIKDDHRMQPIHYACSNYNTSSWRKWHGERGERFGWGCYEGDNNIDMRPIIMLLFENGADVNAVGNSRDTPIFHAIYSRVPERVRLLLDLGADLTCENGNGVSVFQAARNNFRKFRCQIILDMILDEPRRRLRQWEERNERCIAFASAGMPDSEAEVSMLSEPGLIDKILEWYIAGESVQKKTGYT